MDYSNTDRDNDNRIRHQSKMDCCKCSYKRFPYSSSVHFCHKCAFWSNIHLYLNQDSMDIQDNRFMIYLIRTFWIRGHPTYAVFGNRITTLDWLIARKTVTLKRTRCVHTDRVLRKIKRNILYAIKKWTWDCCLGLTI